MPFKFVPQSTPDVILVEPTVFDDERGFFMEAYKASEFVAAGLPRFVQDNHSRSTFGVLRGLHYQVGAHAQGKLVRVTVGSVFDVAVDIRRESPTFLQWVAKELTAENHRMLFVPAGFAHGFIVLSESADLLYKTTAEYNHAADRSIRWNDPTIGIHWPDIGVEFIVSDKDRAAPLVGDADLSD